MRKEALGLVSTSLTSEEVTMNRLKHLRHRLFCRNAATECIQQYVLDERIVVHRHHCMNCGLTNEFPERPFESELNLLLDRLVACDEVANFEPPTSHLMN